MCGGHMTPFYQLDVLGFITSLGQGLVNPKNFVSLYFQDKVT